MEKIRFGVLLVFGGLIIIFFNLGVVALIRKFIYLYRLKLKSGLNINRELKMGEKYENMYFSRKHNWFAKRIVK